MVVALCEDDEAVRQVLARYLTGWKNETGVPVELLEYKSAEEFLVSYEEAVRADLLLLDIMMKQMDGLALAKRLRELGEDIPLAFITGMRERVFEGYRVQAIDYLLKPVKKEEVFEVLNKALIGQKDREQCLAVMADGEMKKLRFGRIRYAESAAHDVWIYGGGFEARYRAGICALEEELSHDREKRFFRCHRSYLINVAGIEALNKKEVTMEGGARIPLARGKWEELNRVFLKYLRGKV